MRPPLQSAARGVVTFLVSMLVASAAGAEPMTRPFSASLTLTETLDFYSGPCFAMGTIQALGAATQLGKVTATSADCITPSSPTSFSFANSGPGTTSLVFTASSGDRLYATYSGTLTAQPSGPHRITGGFVITGGTGRFVGATGYGTLSGYEDISQVVSGRGQIQAVGTITY